MCNVQDMMDGSSSYINAYDKLVKTAVLVGSSALRIV